ncbi:MAG: MFS transporter [Aigarchaeota archaeon]|nr:MFS transporter [Candidatus Caldarchaeales archaeon]
MRKKFAALLLTWVSWFWSHGTRVGISAITPFLRQRYSMSTPEAAAVPGILNLGFYGFAVLSGKVPSKTGYRNTAAAAALGSAAFMLAAAILDNRFFLYVAVFMTGIFLSLHLPSAIPWLGTLFKGGRQGFIIGVHESAAPAGQTLGPIILAFLVSSAGVSYMFALWSLIPLFAGLGLLLFFRMDKQMPAKVQGGGEKILGAGFLALTLVTVANLVGNLGVVAIVPLHLVDTFGLEKTFVATVVGVSRFLGVFGQPLGGYLHDRYGFYRVALAVTVANFFSNIYMILAPYNPVYPVVMTLQAFVTAMYFPLVYSHLVKTHGAQASQYLGSMFFIAGLAGPTTAPILAGLIAERFGYAVALGYPAALALAGTLTMLYLRKGKNMLSRVNQG